MSGAGNNELFTNSIPHGGEDIEAGSNNHVDRKDSQIDEPLNEMVGRGNYGEHTDCIDEWACSLARILDDIPQLKWSPGHPGRISRIPDNLREIETNAYEPCFVSIGPYHHDSPKTQEMEKRKRLILKCVLKMKPAVTLRDYLEEVKSIEAIARSFYSDFQMDSEKFVHMLLLDSLFILTVFCGMPVDEAKTNQTSSRILNRVDNEDGYESSNQINESMGVEDYNENNEMITTEDETMNEETNDGRPRWSWTVFTHDLFLLENQLPFFVLQKIHDLVYGGPKTQLVSIMKIRVGILLVGYTKKDSDTVVIEEFHHLLHLCHTFFRPTLQQESTANQLNESSQMFRLESAVQLYEAGVKFEAKTDTIQHSLLDVTLGSSGTMTMPYLHVDDNIGSLLRNLIALEQMKYPSMGLDVSAYAVLMLHLITTPDDVKLLRRKGIIQHHLASDKEMMYIVNSLSVGLAFDYTEDKYNLKHVFQELKRYTERKLPRWRAGLKHRYFRNPWMGISLLAAIFLLFLSVVQTYYAMYSYYHPFFDGHS